MIRGKWVAECAFLAIFVSIAVVSIALPQMTAADSASRQEFLRRLVAAAVERTHHSLRYVSAYVRIPYPGGYVPADTGVCTDEIIRSYRAVGFDLQKKFMKTWCGTSLLIRTSGDGCWHILIPTSTIAEFQTLWCSSSAKERRCPLLTAPKITRRVTSSPGTWAAEFHTLGSLWTANHRRVVDS